MSFKATVSTAKGSGEARANLKGGRRKDLHKPILGLVHAPQVAKAVPQPIGVDDVDAARAGVGDRFRGSVLGMDGNHMCYARVVQTAEVRPEEFREAGQSRRVAKERNGDVCARVRWKPYGRDYCSGLQFQTTRRKERDRGREI